MSLLSTRTFLRFPQPSRPFVCVLCAASRLPRPQIRLLSATVSARKSETTATDKTSDAHSPSRTENDAADSHQKDNPTKAKRRAKTKAKDTGAQGEETVADALPESSARAKASKQLGKKKKKATGNRKKTSYNKKDAPEKAGRTLREALQGEKKRTSKKKDPLKDPLAEAGRTLREALQNQRKRTSKKKDPIAATGRTDKGSGDEDKPASPSHWPATLPIEELAAGALDFEAVPHEIPPVPRLSYGLDRVLFNAGVYRLRDPRSRVYNFDPYLEKIMPVNEFDFDALTEYKTSSKDQDLLDLTRKLNTKFTGSTSSMSSVLQHFHFLLSDFRPLNHNMLSRGFPNPSSKFSKITTGPAAIFLRYKDGIYAVDADKTFDSPNIMSWLGHSMEKLLTSSREEFESFRRTSTDAAPTEDQSGKCFHYSKIGNFLLRSQLDAHDDRLPGTGIFDLKTRAVVSIRMDSDEYDLGSGYQIRYDHGQWESYEREFFDMTRATLLKYSLQVRMGRMDGIFVAYHNIERIFGFQYLSLPDMDNVLHGQTDTCLGDQEFKLSVGLLDEIFQRVTAKYPETTIRLHVETQQSVTTSMRIFAEPVTEEEADALQDAKNEERREFERTVIGLKAEPNDPDVQAAWKNIQSRVDEELVEEGEPQGSSADEGVGSIEAQPGDEEDAEDEGGPLMGWTLTVRNRVNGAYVDRPEKLTPDDEWTIEYYLKEMEEETVWKAYKALQKRRETLIGKSKEEQAAELQSYRNLIHRYSRAGRVWRQKQDEIDAQSGQTVYRPIGPGSDEVIRQMSGSG